MSRINRLRISTGLRVFRRCRGRFLLLLNYFFGFVFTPPMPSRDVRRSTAIATIERLANYGVWYGSMCQARPFNRPSAKLQQIRPFTEDMGRFAAAQ